MRLAVRWVAHFDPYHGCDRLYEAKLLGRHGTCDLPVIGGGNLQGFRQRTAGFIGSHLIEAIRQWTSPHYRTLHRRNA